MSALRLNKWGLQNPAAKYYNDCVKILEKRAALYKSKERMQAKEGTAEHMLHLVAGIEV